MKDDVMRCYDTMSNNKRREQRNIIKLVYMYGVQRNVRVGMQAPPPRYTAIYLRSRAKSP